MSAVEVIFISFKKDFRFRDSISDPDDVPFIYYEAELLLFGIWDNQFENILKNVRKFWLCPIAIRSAIWSTKKNTTQKTHYSSTGYENKV